MTKMSFHEARTHLSELLDQVAKGKSILITRRGKAAAVLGPPPSEESKDVRQVIAEIKALRRGNVLGDGLTVRGLIEEGRRF